MSYAIGKLYIEPTSACNLNCSMCFRHNWIDEKSGFMTEETFENLFKGEFSVKSVMFGGMGEPLLHKNIIEMVRRFSEKGIKTELLTNATMLNRELSEKLIEAGLNTLWVSVDGFSREEYEKIHIGSRFDLITENLKYFHKIKGSCESGLTYVVMRDNLEEVKKINDFADGIGFDYINLSYAVPSSPVEIENSCYDQGFKIGKQKRVDFDTFYPRKLNSCPFIEENNCFVKWNGEVVPCMQLLHSSYTYYYGEKREVMGKTFGNINEVSLNEVWNSEEYSSFRDKVRNFDFPDCTLCDGCDDRLKNRQDCMYNEFPTCGACLWAQGIGRCP